jgi:hypothetical protein
MSNVPSSTPRQTRDQSVAQLVGNATADEFALLGIRGYYLNTMGAAGAHDRGIYDGAIMLITPSAYVSFNANADPSAFRTGIANLRPGVYQYQLGIHGLKRPGGAGVRRIN